MSDEQDRRQEWADAFPERRSGDGRRSHPRASVTLAARGSAESPVTVPVTELSVGGLYLDQDIGLREGDPVEFELLVPGSDSPVRIAGIIRYLAGDGGPRPGQGIRFDRLAPSDEKVIEVYLDRLTRARAR